MKRVKRSSRALATAALAAVALAGCSSPGPDSSAASALPSAAAAPGSPSASASASGAAPSASGSPSGSAGGLAAASADEILAAARDALLRATTVHAKGDLVSAGTTYTIDLRMVRGLGAVGTMGVEGTTLKLVRIKDTAYVLPDAAFLRDATDSADAARLLAGKYLKVTAKRSSALSPYVALTDAGQTFGPALAPAGTLTKGKVVTVAGVRAIDVVVDGGKGGHVLVALTGTPYPVRIVSGGKTPRSVDLDAYGARVKLVAPPASQVRAVPGF